MRERVGELLPLLVGDTVWECGRVAVGVREGVRETLGLGEQEPVAVMDAEDVEDQVGVVLAEAGEDTRNNYVARKHSGGTESDTEYSLQYSLLAIDGLSLLDCPPPNQKRVVLFSFSVTEGSGFFIKRI